MCPEYMFFKSKFKTNLSISTSEKYFVNLEAKKEYFKPWLDL